MAFNGYNNYNYGSNNPYMNQNSPAQNYFMNSMNGTGNSGNMQMNGNSYGSGYPQSYQMNSGNMYSQQMPQASYQGNGYSSVPSPTPQYGAGKPIWVSGEMEARMWPVKEPLWFMDSTNMVSYFKSPDMPEMEIWDMVKRTPGNGVVQTQYPPQISMDNDPQATQSSQEQNMENYATWDALHNLEDKVNEMMEAKRTSSAPATSTASGRRGNNNG